MCHDAWQGLRRVTTRNLRVKGRQAPLRWVKVLQAAQLLRRLAQQCLVQVGVGHHHHLQQHTKQHMST